MKLNLAIHGGNLSLRNGGRGGHIVNKYIDLKNSWIILTLNAFRRNFSNEQMDI